MINVQCNNISESSHDSVDRLMSCRLQGSSRHWRFSAKQGGPEALATERFPKKFRCVEGRIIVEELGGLHDSLMRRPLLMLYGDVSGRTVDA